MNVVFDLGGVVFRWQPHEFLPRLLPHRAGSEAAASALVKEFFGTDWVDFDRGVVDEARLIHRIAWRTGLPVDDVRHVVDAVPAELKPVKATVELMQRLRDRGHTLHYLSNMPAPLAQGLLAAHPFMQWFSGGLFSSEVKMVKPEPAIFREAQARFGVAPGQLLFIDDYGLNVTAARAQGWEAIHFLSAEQCAAALASRLLL
jgi:putative hydrolase of the HAD superfamily